MAAECVIFQQLFVIVWHTDQIQLDDVVFGTDPRRMNVSMDETLLVEICHRVAQLAEVQHDLRRREWPLAERLPVLDVVWCLQVEQDDSLLNSIRV